MTEPHAEGVRVTSGDPSDRPAGTPCFGCGRQVRTARRTAVFWPNGVKTKEAVCYACASTYPMKIVQRDPADFPEPSALGRDSNA